MKFNKFSEVSCVCRVSGKLLETPRQNLSESLESFFRQIKVSEGCKYRQN